MFYCLSVQVLQKVDVVETLQIEKYQKQRIFKVTFKFLPPDRYRDDVLLSPHKILHYMETRCVSLVDPLCPGRWFLFGPKTCLRMLTLRWEQSLGQESGQDDGSD